VGGSQQICSQFFSHLENLLVYQMIFLKLLEMLLEQFFSYISSFTDKTKAILVECLLKQLLKADKE